MEAENASPAPIDFRTAFCQSRGLPEKRFEEEVLKRTLTWNARLVRPIISLFHPDAFYPEISLVRQAGDKIDFDDIRLDIDFYQHKFVSNSSVRDLFRFRVSGIRLQRLALNAFRSTRGSGRARRATSSN